MRGFKPAAAMAGLIAALPIQGQAGDLATTSTNAYGLPGGLLDMPTAEVAPDGQLSGTISHSAGMTRTTMTFQIMPRLTGSFRYSAISGYKPTGYTLGTYYDRSFDLKYQVLKEGNWYPGVAVGLQDFIGTGLYSAEYVVATKTIGQRLRLTGGLGWGRLGSYNSFATTGTRPTTGAVGSGGNIRTDRFFRGPVAAFGGLSYQASDKLSFAVEYSSDAYVEETGAGTQGSTAVLLNRKSPWNFGLKYKVSNAVSLGAYYMHGSEVGLNVTVALNAKSSPVPGGAETAPLPVAVRASAADLGWTVQPGAADSARSSVAQSLASEGLILEGMALDGNSARILIRNERYDIEAQAVGRAARVLTRTLPGSVENFTIAQTFNGIPSSAITMKRSDVERLENAAAGNMLNAASFSGGADAWNGIEPVDGAYPRLSWSFGPYMKMSVFDPDNPVRADVGLNLKGDYYMGPGWVLSGSVSAKLTGNLDAPSTGRTGGGAGTLPPVRSDKRYLTGNDPKIDYLTLAKYGRLGDDWYGRVTLGYLEPMYAGISGEVLWKPVDSRLAFGAEVNYVKQREFDQLFGLRSYEVATGHLSAYYDFGRGFHGQVDVGRYLAGDWGATVALDREFDNGWRVGAYVTKTNVSAAAFGEGSFDKGIRITMPLSWAIGSPTRKKNNIVIQSLTRNGGARLNVNGRLYEPVRDTHRPEMAKTWGRFWR